MPVMLEESISSLSIKPDGTYVDATFGGGGHSRAIMERLAEGGHLYGFDQDADAERNITSATDGRFTFVRSNFRYLRQWMRYYGVDHIDGLIADLGVSAHHLDDGSRGFSFRFDAPIDMRMNRRGGKTAADVLKAYSEERLADVFYLYGELRNARRLAAAIVKERKERPIVTTGDLMGVVGPLLPRERQRKDAARIFQALRIEVNHEMDALRDLLRGAVDCLGEGGRLVVITYHSLEDRIVKNVMKTGNDAGKAVKDFYGRTRTPLRPIGGVRVPTEEEQQRNPRSRSAKLRVAEKI